MTESELLASADFLKWCAIWEQSRHCPHAMADWALENVGELAFEACVWAHEKEERRAVYSGEICGVMPRRLTSSRQYAWWQICIEAPEDCADDVPIVESTEGTLPFDSFPAAIAYYLTHFDRKLAAKYPPKVLEAV